MKWRHSSEIIGKLDEHLFLNLSDLCLYNEVPLYIWKYYFT